MTKNLFSLENKCILITGASSGIGRCIAIECSKLGACLVLLGRSVKGLAETLGLLVVNDAHRCFAGDLNDESFLRKVVSEIDYLDGFVNSAGFLQKKPFRFVDFAHLNQTLSVNFSGPAMLVQQLCRKNKIHNGGSIVFIGSIAHNTASYGNVSYMASKGALNSFSKGIALELAAKSIRVNVVNPALVITDMVKSNLSVENLDNYLKKFPLQRFGKPEDIAYSVIFLLADESCWITGTSLTIDGGVSLT